MTIVGGFDPVSWRRGLQPTVIDTAPHFRENQALIQIVSGKVRLEEIELKDKRNVCSELILISGGSISLKNVKLNRSNRDGGFGLRLNSGSLTITNSIFSADKSTGGILLGVFGGKLTVSGSELIGPSEGDDFTTLPILAVGGKGTISVTSNIAPAEVAGLIDAFEAGDYQKAKKIHYKLWPLNKAMFLETNPIPVKTALSLMKKIAPELRLPLAPMSEINLKKLKQVLKDYKLI